jgi:hypothetical protein
LVSDLNPEAKFAADPLLRLVLELDRGIAVTGLRSARPVPMEPRGNVPPAAALAQSA